MSTGYGYLGVFEGSLSDSGVENSLRGNTSVLVGLTRHAAMLFSAQQYTFGDFCSIHMIVIYLKKQTMLTQLKKKVDLSGYAGQPQKCLRTLNMPK